MATRNPVIQFRKTIRENLKWKRFQAVVDATWDPRFDGYIAEIQDLHRNRTIRHIGAQAHPTGKKLASAGMKDQAARSRAVEIAMEVVTKRNLLAISMNTMNDTIMSTFNEELKSLGARSINDKKNLVHSLFGPAQKLIDDLDTIREVADLMIEDVDKGSYSIKHAVDSLMVATKREASY